MADKTVLVQNIERLMAHQGSNPAALAAMAGLNPTGVRDILMGKSRSPRHQTLEKLANALGVSVFDLLSDEPRAEWLQSIEDLTKDFTDQERRATMAYVQTLRQQRDGL